jgi:exopolysaccharide biosynthesis WecB/TagA/CpsF family protein
MTNIRIGTILIDQDLIEKTQLLDALLQQQHYAQQYQWKRLGEILTERGAISTQDLKQALNKQIQLNSCEDYSDIQSKSLTQGGLQSKSRVLSEMQDRQFAARDSKVQILNMLVDNTTLENLLIKLKEGVVFPLNVDQLVKLQKDEEAFKVYSMSDYRVCDSQILVYASRFLGTPIEARVSGSDFFPMFCDYHKSNQDIKIFLLGAAEGVAKKAQVRINARVGREVVIDSHSPSFGFEKDETECLKIVEKINASQATVLAIGVGAPKQEKWIYNHKDKMPNVKIFLAIGATINFEAGIIHRAPKWASDIGIEWLFRLLTEPKRLWKRYLVDDLAFLWLIFSQKLGFYRSPFKVSESVATLSKELKYH